MPHTLYNILHNCIKAALLVFLLPLCLQAQTYSLEMLTSSEPTNLRGLCPVTDSTIWVCGNYGRIGRSTNGGKNWQWMVPNGYEKSDFRDIEAFDETHAVVMASGYPAVILYTEDGGYNWAEAFRSDDTLAFLDAIDFWDANNGVCIGDWLNNEPYTLLTANGGKTWQLAKHPTIGRMEPGTVASFAASGTCLRTYTDSAGKQCFLYAIGGANNGVINAYPNKKNNYTYQFVKIPYETTAQSQGLFSLCYNTAAKEIWVAGGDYSLPSFGFSGVHNITKSDFSFAQTEVMGYRSCIELFDNKTQPMVIACGLNGADITIQDAKNISWKNIAQVPLNTAIKAKKGNAVFLCGPQGTIYKLVAK
jgi:photosystem II stability/assembly factor-like uncharacterized protein